MRTKSMIGLESTGRILPELLRLRIIGIIFPVAFILGTIGYYHYPFENEPVSITNAMYHAAQLFILHAPHFVKPVPLTLEIGRWLSALTTALALTYTILYLFRHDLEFLEIRRMKKHIILCGLGEIGNALANNITDKKKLLIIEKDTDNENISKLRKQGAKVLKGNATDYDLIGNMRISRASCLFAITGNDFDNLKIVTHVRGLLSNARKKNPELILAANIDSQNLKSAVKQEMLCAADKECLLGILLDEFYNTALKISASNDLKEKDQLTGEFNSLKDKLKNYNPEKAEDSFRHIRQTRLFNINELAAQYIFRQFPPDRFKPVTRVDDPPVHLLIMGFSPIGEELLKLFIQNCHYINKRNTIITLIDHEADLVRQKALVKYKNIYEVIDLRYIKMNPHHLTNTFVTNAGLRNIDMIYICSEQDKYQASYTVKAREVFGKKVPVIRWLGTDVVTSTRSETDTGTFTFEIPGMIAQYKNIINEVMDRKATSTHNRWLKRAIWDYIDSVEKAIQGEKDLKSPKPTILPWHLLDEETRDDNRSVVEHNMVKIRNVGQFTDPEYFLDPEQATVDFSFLHNEAIVNQLAEMEHRRWMATKYYNCWTYNKTRNDERKQHNNLIAFNQLDKGTQDYDLKQINDLEELWKL